MSALDGEARARLPLRPLERSSPMNNRQRRNAVFQPDGFEVSTLWQAMLVTVTPARGTTTLERWHKETRYLIDDIGRSTTASTCTPSCAACSPRRRSTRSRNPPPRRSWRPFRRFRSFEKRAGGACRIDGKRGNVSASLPVTTVACATARARLDHGGTHAL